LRDWRSKRTPNRSSRALIMSEDLFVFTHTLVVKDLVTRFSVTL
jgi:hypothetical protein